MWAMMPMFRVRSSEYCRSTSVLVFLWGDAAPSLVLLLPAPVATEGKREARLRPPLRWEIPLPAIVRERLVGLRHLVRVFPLLHGRAAVVGGAEQLGGELPRHAPPRPPPRGADAPAHRQRRPPVRPHLD